MVVLFLFFILIIIVYCGKYLGFEVIGAHQVGNGEAGLLQLRIIQIAKLFLPCFHLINFFDQLVVKFCHFRRKLFIKHSPRLIEIILQILHHSCNLLNHRAYFVHLTLLVQFQLGHVSWVYARLL